VDDVIKDADQMKRKMCWKVAEVLAVGFSSEGRMQ